MFPFTALKRTLKGPDLRSFVGASSDILFVCVCAGGWRCCAARVETNEYQGGSVVGGMWMGAMIGRRGQRIVFFELRTLISPQNNVIKVKINPLMVTLSDPNRTNTATDDGVHRTLGSASADATLQLCKHNSVVS